MNRNHQGAIARALARIPDHIRYSHLHRREVVEPEPEPRPVAVQPVQRSLFEMETNDGQ